MRTAQRKQAATNGYFGGYIGKRQPSGKLETKKCVDKMHVLREKLTNKSAAEQQRAVTGRMITDLEMNGTLRGAVELFNLTRNMRAGDVLFAECVRTFMTKDVDARPILHRLSVVSQHAPDTEHVSLVPATVKPHVRTERSTVPWADAYGFRPLQPPWRLLSLYEFVVYWRCEALVPPHVYTDQRKNARTTLTETLRHRGAPHEEQDPAPWEALHRECA